MSSYSVSVVISDFAPEKSTYFLIPRNSIPAFLHAVQQEGFVVWFCTTFKCHTC